MDYDYVPQIDDIVVYFQQGHLACLEGGFPDNTNRFPGDIYPKLRPAERCKVLSVKYSFPEVHEDDESSVFCVLLLQLLPDQRGPDARVQVPGVFVEGDRVMAKYKGQYRYPGVITKANSRLSYAVQYDDGDFSKHVPAAHIEYQTFAVSYRRTQLAEFVIPVYRYERNRGKAPFTSGDRFHMRFDDGKDVTYKGMCRLPCALCLEKG